MDFVLSILSEDEGLELCKRVVYKLENRIEDLWQTELPLRFDVSTMEHDEWQDDETGETYEARTGIAACIAFILDETEYKQCVEIQPGQIEDLGDESWDDIAKLLISEVLARAGYVG